MFGAVKYQLVQSMSACLGVVALLSALVGLNDEAVGFAGIVRRLPNGGVQYRWQKR
jgi:hypothetical protein